MAPDAVKEITLKQLMGRKLAIDASNFIYQVRAQWRVRRVAVSWPSAYLMPSCKQRSDTTTLVQFLVAVRASDGDGPAQMLTNEAGEVTR